MMTKHMYSDAAKFNSVTDNGVTCFFDGRCEQSQSPPQNILRKIQNSLLTFLMCPLVTDYAIR